MNPLNIYRPAIQPKFSGWKELEEQEERAARRRAGGYIEEDVPPNMRQSYSSTASTTPSQADNTAMALATDLVARPYVPMTDGSIQAGIQALLKTTTGAQKNLIQALVNRLVQSKTE